MALINSPNRFQFNVLLTNTISNFHVDIPNFFDDYNTTKFLVTSILGKTSTGPSPVFVHSSALRNNGILYLNDNSNDLIATTVLSNIVSNSFSYNAKMNDIGFVFPSNLIKNGIIDFTIRDHLGNLLNDLDYIVITIEVFQN